MLRVAVGLLFVVAALACLGRIENDVSYKRTVQGRLYSAMELAQGLIAEGHLGVLDAEPVRDFPKDDPIFERAVSVGQLTIRYSEQTFGCTATAISPELIITNQHCVENKEAPVALRFVTDLLDHGDGFTHEIAWPPVEQNARLDYAILRVVHPTNIKMPKSSGLRLRDAVPGEGLLMYHHPQFRHLLVTRAHCRVRRENPFQDSDLLHTCRMAGGSSGALLIATRDGAVVGLNYGTGRLKSTNGTIGLATSAGALLAQSAELQKVLGLPPTP
jgi:hypothetical protein